MALETGVLYNAGSLLVNAFPRTGLGTIRGHFQGIQYGPYGYTEQEYH